MRINGPLPARAVEYAMQRAVADEVFARAGDREGLSTALQRVIARDAGRLLEEALHAGTLDVAEPMYLIPSSSWDNMIRAQIVELRLIVGTRLPDQPALEQRTKSALPAPRKEIDQ